MRAKVRKCNTIPDHHGASAEYFERARKLPVKDWGYPRALKGLGTNEFEVQDSVYFYDLVHKDITKLKTYLGALDNALCMYYPPEGFIGWHHNGNASGYNILFSYSTDGKGYFEYFDVETQEIVRIQDKIGWNVKAGYYPSERKEPKRVYWHAASTDSPRLSVAFIINNRDMWSNMIETITGNSFDYSVIEKQGPLDDLSK
jgi:hypothetical protein